MKIINGFCLIILFFSVSVFSQIATKIDVFNLTDNRLQCGTVSKLDNIYLSFKDSLQSKLYIIYYEGQYRATSVYNFKTKKLIPKSVYPKRADALNKAKEIPLYLTKVYKIPAKQLVLVDGGFRQSFALEVWSVPEGAEIPKPTPTLDRKDIKFVKGKPYETKNLANCYSNF